MEQRTGQGALSSLGVREWRKRREGDGRGKPERVLAVASVLRCVACEARNPLTPEVRVRVTEELRLISHRERMRNCDAKLSKKPKALENKPLLHA